MRDAISLLDQCIAFYIGEELTYDKVLKNLGAVDTEIFSKLLRAIIAHNTNEAIGVVEEIVSLGRALDQFVNDFIWYLRNLMLLTGDANMEDALEMSSENLARLKEEAAMVDMEVVMRYIRVASELLAQMKYSTQKRVMLEIAIAKLCCPQMEKDYGSLIDRINLLEQKLEEGVPMAAPVMMQGMTAPEPVKKKEFPKAVAEDVKKALREWRNFINQVDNGPLQTYLKDGKATVEEDGSFVLVYDAHDPKQKLSYDICEKRSGEISEMLSEFMEVDISVKIILNNSGVDSSRIYPDAIAHFAQEADIKIDVEDF